MTERFLQLVSRPQVVTVTTILVVACSWMAAVASKAYAAGQAGNRPAIPTWEQEASDVWYEGALLGNGDLGVIVFGAKDQITFAIGKNDFWDRRCYRKFQKPISYRRYMEVMKNTNETDAKTGRIIPPKSILETSKPVPSVYSPLPKPIGQLNVYVTDRSCKSGRQPLAPIHHILSLQDAELATTTPVLKAVSRVQKNKNILIIRVACPPEGAVVTLHRNPDSAKNGIEPPHYSVEGSVGCLIQDMPAEDTYPDGFRVAVAGTVVDGGAPALSAGQISWSVAGEATLMLAIATTRDDPEPAGAARTLLTNALDLGPKALEGQHRNKWREFWDASWIKIDDDDVQRWWYMHNYLLACSARPGAVAPGLFGPWIVENTSAWRGGYTMDYNFQQTFASALSCNHPELLEPYLETIERMLPAAWQLASKVFEADGIAFPHQIFPLDMHHQWYVHDLYVCETPWTVLHFWERYEYTLDEEFLRARAYPVLAGCADFLACYATPQADGKYAFELTKSPEHHHLLLGLPFNRNGAPELALARYAFKAALKAAEILGEDGPRVAKWRKVLDGLPDYPRLRNQLGDVFLDCEATPQERHFVPSAPLVANMRPSKVPGNHGPWMTYNYPTSLMQVWPAGQIDMDSPPKQLLTAIRTWHTLKCEGSNDLIMRHVVAARLGIPTLRQFKREIAPRLMSNGSICILMNMIAEGGPEKEIYTTRYFMFEKNGIYTENFAYPLVINEMMLQSHNGVLKFFPTMDYYRTAEFHNLRARGGFLVSAAMDRGFTLWAEVIPTVDGTCRIRLPWPAYAVCVMDAVADAPVAFRIDDNDILFDTARGKIYRLEPKLTFSKCVISHIPSGKD